MTATITKALAERTRLHNTMLALHPFKSAEWFRSKAARLDEINARLRELAVIPGQTGR